MAGKGDSPRPVNVEKYGKNYDDINWKSKKSVKEVKDGKKEK